MNYKSGDLVKIAGNCNYHNFTIGETVRLKEKDGSDWISESLEGGKHWWVRESDMTPTKATAMPQKIIITTDGKITLARLFDGKTMVKRAEAKCAPSDVFDFGVGAELAVKRLMGEKPVTEPVKSESVKLYCVKSYKPGEWFTKGKVYETDCKDNFTTDDGYQPHGYEWREDCTLGGMPWSYYLVPLTRRPAKVGEWVYITESCDDRAEVGSIYKVMPRECGGNSLYIAHPRGTRRTDGAANIVESKYLVLDGYTGDPA